MKEMSEDSKKRGVIVDEQCHYGTFQGVANYYPQPQHIVSIPQPVPPDGATNHPRYPHGYQTITTGNLRSLFLFLVVCKLYYLQIKFRIWVCYVLV